MSPGSTPGAWSASPVNVILCPCFMPLSTCTSRILTSLITFFPSHFLQRSFSLITSPVKREHRLPLCSYVSQVSMMPLFIKYIFWTSFDSYLKICLKHHSQWKLTSRCRLPEGPSRSVSSIWVKCILKYLRGSWLYFLKLKRDYRSRNNGQPDARASTNASLFFVSVRVSFNDGWRTQIKFQMSFLAHYYTVRSVPDVVYFMEWQLLRRPARLSPLLRFAIAELLTPRADGCT